MPVVRLPATPDGGQPPRLRPEDIAEIPPFRPSFKPEDLAEIPPFRGALDEIPPWQPPVTTSPVSSNPEGPDFIDDDASYDDAPVTNDAGTEYCVLCARAVELSADGKHNEATAQMDAALATGLASEDPVMLTTARVPAAKSKAQAACKAAKAGLAWLDSQALGASKPFLCGERFTVADIRLYVNYKCATAAPSPWQLSRCVCCEARHSDRAERRVPAL